jgi:hypothetical protein
LTAKEEQNQKLKSKVRASMHKIAEMEAYIQGRQQANNDQLVEQIQTLQKEMEEMGS